MSAQLKKGIIVWVLVFMTFLAAVNVLYATMYGVDRDAHDKIEPYLINIVFRDGIQLQHYFWISVAATCILLAITSIMACRGVPDPHVVWRLDKLEEGIVDNTERIRAAQMSLVEDLEDNKKTRKEFRDEMTSTLTEMRKEMFSILEKNGEKMQETNQNMQKIASGITSTLQEHGESIQQITASVENATKETRNALKSTMEKQREQIGEIIERVERLEEDLVPQPILTSRSKPEEIKGVGPRLGEELRNLGITTVTDLLTADSRLVAEETRASRDAVQHFQAIAQLSMIPGISQDDAELLEEVGITTRTQLATQGPLRLSQKLETITKTYIEEGKLDESEKPTVEEIVSWIRRAKI